MRNLMLAVLAVGAVYSTSSTPAAAMEFPYCLLSRETGNPGDCNYRSYAECMTTASGRGAWCNVNPRYALVQPRRGAYYPDGRY